MPTPHEETLNPYLHSAGRRAYQESYREHVVAAQRWRVIGVLALLVACGAVAGMVMLASQAQIVPYVVKVDRLGASIAVDRADIASKPDKAVIVAQLARWVMAVRSVWVAAGAQRGLVKEAYAMINARADAYGALNDHMRAHDPFERAKTETIAVEVQSVLPISGDSWRIEWREETRSRDGVRADAPVRGEDGSIVFVFGSTLPTVVCAPLYVCDLALQPGESVNDLNVGDGVRWQITPATQGAGERLTTHVMIKPTDVGLLTNLVITTDRRAYTIKLVSQRTEWMPRVSFSYPEDARSEWGAYRTRQEALREKVASAAPSESAGHLDFGYEISGDSPSWRPVRVYASGAKTYIQFPKGVAHGDLPALVALGDDGGLFTEPSKQLVNYRYVQGRFEVDKVLGRAALISGVGWDQTTVKISRRGRE